MHCPTCDQDVRPVTQLETNGTTSETCPNCAHVLSRGETAPTAAERLKHAKQTIAHVSSAGGPSSVGATAIVEDLLAREADLVAEISRLDALKRELKQIRKMLRAAGPNVVRSAKVIPIAKGAG